MILSLSTLYSPLKGCMCDGKIYGRVRGSIVLGAGRAAFPNCGGGRWGRGQRFEVTGRNDAD